MLCHTAPVLTDMSQCTTKIKWDDSLRDEFRRSLISRLTNLNSIVNHVDISDRNSINTCIENFSRVLNEIANPLFCKEVRITRSKSSTLSENKICKKAEWFDDECRTAKQLYLNALNIFSLHKSDENRINMHDLKCSYKRLVRRKKRSFEIHKIRQIERLRHSKPREFWKLFVKRKKSNTNISQQDFFKYFSKMQQDLNNVQDLESEHFCQTNDFDSQDCNFEELDKLITFEV